MRASTIVKVGGGAVCGTIILALLGRAFGADDNLLIDVIGAIAGAIITAWLIETGRI